MSAQRGKGERAALPRPAFCVPDADHAESSDLWHTDVALKAGAAHVRAGVRQQAASRRCNLRGACQEEL